MKNITIKIDKEQTIISLLKSNFNSTPLSLIYKLFRKKKVLVDSLPVRFYHHRVKKNSVISITDNSLVFNKKTKFIKPFEPNVEFKIVYEDENIIVVVKDHGIETHSKDFSSSLDNAVSYYLKDLPNFNKNRDLIVTSSHRIDKLTKGLVVYAKNSFVKVEFHKLFSKQGKIKKKYLAVCKGKVRQKLEDLIGEVNGFIFKDDLKQRMVFNFKSDDDKQDLKKCSMNVKKIFSRSNYFIFEIELYTGRKHQIRSYFSSINLPIVGDKKYGSDIELQSKIKLFAYSIEFKDMPKELSYLNNLKLEIPIKKLLVSQISSLKEGILPKKFIKY
ncbi:MAG TPA: RluA family pseudouridine synthase [Mycoplasmatales bacterium]|jgi:23S rRNA pseudouridine955/2504/2580 synthase|nr:RluA family pseudouridine synthase [Mycoplasmatales bacterium]